MEGITARRSCEGDIGHLKTLVGADGELYQQRYGEYKFSFLVENSYICITICEAAGRVVAFAAFSDSPPKSYSPQWYQWVKRFPNAPHYSPSTSLWLAFYVADPLFEVDGFTLSLKTAFQTVPCIDYVLYQMPKDVTLFVPIRDNFEVEEARITDDSMLSEYNVR